MPALNIFETSLRRGKFDENRTLPNGKLLDFAKARGGLVPRARWVPLPLRPLSLSSPWPRPLPASDLFIDRGSDRNLRDPF